MDFSRDTKAVRRALIALPLLAVIALSLVSFSGTIGATGSADLDPTIEYQSAPHVLSEVDYSALWNRTYGAFDNDRFYDIVHCSDGGYALVGYTTSLTMADQDVWVVRTNENGDALWTTAFSIGSLNDRGQGITECANGDFVICGSYETAANPDAMVCRIDDTGELLWTYELGGTGFSDILYDVIEADNGNIIAVGSTNTWGAGNYDALAVCLTSNGSPVWTRAYGGHLDEQGQEVVESSSGGYAILSSTRTFGAGDADFYLLRLDVSGNVLWNRTYGDTADDVPYGMVENAWGGFAMVGMSESFGDPAGDVYLVRTDSTGHELGEDTYPGAGQDFATAVVESFRGGYAIACITGFLSGADQTRLIRVEYDGTQVWSYPYGGANVDYSYGIAQPRPDEFVLAGCTNSYGAGGFDGWLLLVPGPPRITSSFSDQFIEFGEYFVTDVTAESTAPLDHWWLDDTSVFQIVGGTIYSPVAPSVGMYEVWVHVNNTAGYEAELNFWVYVDDFTAPTWREQPENQTIEFGEMFYYELGAEDLSPLDEWIIEGPAGFDIDDGGVITSDQIPQVGEYVLEVTVDDIYSNALTAVITVTVEDTTAPEWVETPEDQDLHYGDYLVYDLNATDLSGIASWEVEDTARFSVDYQGRIRSLVSLAPGTHGVTVHVTDTHGNVLTGNFVVTVAPDTSGGSIGPNIWTSTIPFIAGVGATLVVGSVVCVASRRSSSKD